MRRAGASQEGIQRVLRLAEGHEPWVDVDDAYEQTLARARKRKAPALRKVANPPLRRNFLAAAARGVAAAARTGAAAIRSSASAARLAASEAGTAARVAAGEAKVVAGVAAGEVRAAAGVAGEVTQKGARAFLRSAAGKTFIKQVSATAATLFGAEVVRRASLSPEQTKLLRATLERKRGENIDPELITAALRSKK
jgi:hypothetical protein